MITKIIVYTQDRKFHRFLVKSDEISKFVFERFLLNGITVTAILVYDQLYDRYEKVGI